jgi:surfeit locus 1 family protein
VRSHERKRLGLLALCLVGTLLFTALGVWQVQRLAWKRDLIARIAERIEAADVPAPAPGEWASLDLRDAEYRRVRARGVYLHDRETLVDAVTVLGAGAWVLTPLQTAEGVILVNRGFVPPELREPAARPAGQVPGEVTVTGLLRRSEPDGRILRPNQPAAGRWFSRDVAAIADASELNGVAPFFIDSDDVNGASLTPQGGLTVVQFRNAHLAYAATWFGLAVLCVVGAVLVRQERAPRLT